MAAPAIRNCSFVYDVAIDIHIQIYTAISRTSQRSSAGLTFVVLHCHNLSAFIVQLVHGWYRGMISVLRRLTMMLGLLHRLQLVVMIHGHPVRDMAMMRMRMRLGLRVRHRRWHRGWRTIMIKGSRSARDVRAAATVPRMRRSDDGGMKRQDSIRCRWIFPFPNPWRTITFNLWAWLLSLSLCTSYGSTFFLQHNDLLRCIVSSDCLLVSLSADV